jgi:hypothetical protein
MTRRLPALNAKQVIRALERASVAAAATHGRSPELGGPTFHVN